MQAFDLIKMQLLKIILLLSVFVLSSVLATGMLRWGIFFNKRSSIWYQSSWIKNKTINFLPEPVLWCSSSLIFCFYELTNFLCSERQEPDKVVSSDGPNRGVSYVKFVEEKFSYLNITALGGDFVDNMPECSFACLDIPSCFSFNLGTTPEANDRFRCELLPSDKYNNSDKFEQSLIFHHFSIAVSENYEKQVNTEVKNQRSSECNSHSLTDGQLIINLSHL